MDNIFIEADGHIIQQNIVISMGINCVPLLADISCTPVKQNLYTKDKRI